MSIASVLIPSDQPDGAATSSPGPRYSLLLSTDPSLIEAAQRLRYDVFSSTPGFALPGVGDGQTDVDRFDEYCDHLPEDSIQRRNSTFARLIRCGRRWWRWDARWCATVTATVASCC
jgi:hypothetical protein